MWSQFNEGLTYRTFWYILFFVWEKFDHEKFGAERVQELKYSIF